MTFTPYFSQACSDRIAYGWDSRTATRELSPETVNGQTLSFSSVSGLSTPEGAAALLIRCINFRTGTVTPRHIFCSTQHVTAASGDKLVVKLPLRAEKEFVLEISLDDEKQPFRCLPGWNRLRAALPIREECRNIPKRIAFEACGLETGDIFHIGTLEMELIGQPGAEPLSLPSRDIHENDEWIRCDLDDLYVKRGTALDFSELVPKLDMDRLGRVVATPDGHLAFANDRARKVRFMGHSMSLTRQTIPATKPEIGEFCDALATQGYNLFRLHGANALLMDGSKGWDGTLPTTPETIPFDTDAEDRLHYMLYCMKQRGIYMYLDLCSFMNGWHSGDVWTSCGPWIRQKHGTLRYSSMVLYGDPEARANFRAGALRLLTAVNPYTKMRLADDPAIAFLLFYNELLMTPCDALSEQWGAFLKERYHDFDALREAMPELEAFGDWSDVPFSATPESSAAYCRAMADFSAGVFTEATGFFNSVACEAGYSGLVNQFDNSRSTVNLEVNNALPMMTNHVYHWCPHKFFYPGSSEGRSSSIFTGLGYFRRGAQMRYIDRPFGLTEYGHPYWNAHRFEQGVCLGSYGALQDWDMLVTHSCPVMKKGGELRPFSGGNDPCNRASEAVAVCAFLRGDVASARHSVAMRLAREIVRSHPWQGLDSLHGFLALLTRIGIVYEKEPSATLVLDALCSEDANLFTPEYFKQYTGSPNIAALIETIRQKGVLSPANKTDIAAGVWHSETEELLLNILAETMEVRTPRMEGAVVRRGGNVTLDHMEICSPDNDAALNLIARDGLKILDEALAMLLICNTNCLNEGSRFLAPESRPDLPKTLVDSEGRVIPGNASSEEVLLDNGHEPVLRQRFRAGLKISAPSIKSPALFALEFNGERAGEIPFEYGNGRIRLELDTAQAPSPFYELTDKLNHR